MKILLINAAYKERPAPDQPPYGLLYVGTALQRAGHTVSIIDPDVKKLTPEEVIAQIQGQHFDVIGIGGLITGYYFHKPLVQALKKIYPSTPIIAGGYIACLPELLLRTIGVDIVVLGEGEITITKLIAAIEKGTSYDALPGIAYVKNGAYVQNPPEEVLRPLDSIAYPEYSLINMHDYLMIPTSDSYFAKMPGIERYVQAGHYAFNIKTARGCTSQCTFCYRHMPGFRQQTLEVIMQHIRFLYDTYNVRLFQIDDELFTANKKLVAEFCAALRSSGMDILFRITGARVDTITEELLAQLKAAGCVAIDYGIESGSQTMLDRMKKRTTVAQNLRAVQLTIAAGIQTCPQIIIGMPGENERTIRETEQFIKQCGLPVISISFATAYPKTELYDYARARGMITDEEEYIMKLTNMAELILNFSDLSYRQLVRVPHRLRQSLRLYLLRKDKHYIRYILGVGKKVLDLLEYTIKDSVLMLLGKRT